MPFIRRAAILLLFSIALFTIFEPFSSAAEYKLMLASQFDWNFKTGFFLDLESSAPGDHPIPISSLTLNLFVGDGKRWTSLSNVETWNMDEVHTVTATITPSASSLTLDGKPIPGTTGAFRPENDALFDLNRFYEDSKPLPIFDVAVSEISVQRNGETPIMETFEYSGEVAARDKFSGGDARSIDLNLAPTDTLKISVTFKLTKRFDLHPFAPLIDRYGQLRFSDPPPTITSDDQLRALAKSETAQLSREAIRPSFDPFGGSKNSEWSEKATGYYRVVQRNGFWWLITPDGNPCFYIGLCTAPALHWDVTPVTGREYLFETLPPETGEFRDAWSPHAWGDKSDTKYFSFIASNLIRKYGQANYVKLGNESTIKRMRAWGFTGVGKWGDFDGEEALPRTPSVPVLYHDDVPNRGRHPDIFDPKIRQIFRQTLVDQIGTHVHDPYIVGWSCGNELDDLITKEDVDNALASTTASPLKRALVQKVIDSEYNGMIESFAKSQNLSPTMYDLITHPLKVSDTVNMKLRIYWMDKYYGFMYLSVKACDPNHLYFGFWPSLNEFPPSEWPLTTKWCDVFGYDYYDREFSDQHVAEFLSTMDRPVFCGEFSFAPWNDGKSGFGRYDPLVKDDADEIALYNRWMHDAATNPKCVGVCWFQYRDEPVTGRGPGHGDQPVIGENYAFGLVDVTDTPKQTLVSSVATANRQALQMRLDASR